MKKKQLVVGWVGMHKLDDYLCPHGEAAYISADKKMGYFMLYDGKGPRWMQKCFIADKNHTLAKSAW